MKFFPAMLCVFSMIVSWQAFAASDQILIDNFENGLNTHWTTKSFEGETRYSVVADGDGHVLQAQSEASASGLAYEIDFDPVEHPILSWRWKIAGTNFMTEPLEWVLPSSFSLAHLDFFDGS